MPKRGVREGQGALPGLLEQSGGEDEALTLFALEPAIPEVISRRGKDGKIHGKSPRTNRIGTINIPTEPSQASLEAIKKLKRQPLNDSDRADLK